MLGPIVIDVWFHSAPCNSIVFVSVAIFLDRSDDALRVGQCLQGC
jgi:hypothetical protein